ncbi:helix-turn-helix domain-containing protein [Tissierella praeacuta]|uniref:helix-turn-helix domain-containing protein n=1 Tax=Tissierella praeacuta TaxID=43131 RepID=UPI0028AAE1AD|nr:helix-turn-helix transcriptional regulator [Tissierella praeacuta]
MTNLNSELIKNLRIQKGLSIRQLAKLADVAKSQISDIENGHLQNTTISTICKLAKVLEVNVTDLFEC